MRPSTRKFTFDQLGEAYDEVSEERSRFRIALIEVGRAMVKQNGCSLCTGFTVDQRFHHDEGCPMERAVAEYRQWKSEQPE